MPVAASIAAHQMQKPEPIQLAGTSSNAAQEPALQTVLNDASMSQTDPSKGTVDGKRPAAAAELEDIAPKKLTSDIAAASSASDRID